MNKIFIIYSEKYSQQRKRSKKPIGRKFKMRSCQKRKLLALKIWLIMLLGSNLVPHRILLKRSIPNSWRDKLTGYFQELALIRKKMLWRIPTNKKVKSNNRLMNSRKLDAVRTMKTAWHSLMTKRTSSRQRQLRFGEVLNKKNSICIEPIKHKSPDSLRTRQPIKANKLRVRCRTWHKLLARLLGKDRSWICIIYKMRS